MKGEFCPSCGETRGPFFKGLCKKCFTRQRKLIEVQEELKIEQCKFCNKIRIEGKWVEQNGKALKEFVAKKVKAKGIEGAKTSVSLEPLGETTLARVKVTGKVDGNPITIEAKTLLVALPTQCDACMRIRSEYFEATLQIRFSKEPSLGEKQKLLGKISEQVEELKKKDALAVIVDVVQRKQGFDILIASNKAAQKVVKKLASKVVGPVKKSFKLIGHDKKGKEKKKFTYCLRL